MLLMFDFQCCMTQGKNALIIWASTTLVHVTVICCHKLINFHTHISSLKTSLFLIAKSCFFKRHIARSQNLCFTLWGPAKLQQASPWILVLSSIWLVSYTLLNMYVLFMGTTCFYHLKLSQQVCHTEILNPFQYFFLPQE